MAELTPQERSWYAEAEKRDLLTADERKWWGAYKKRFVQKPTMGDQVRQFGAGVVESTLGWPGDLKALTGSEPAPTEEVLADIAANPYAAYNHMPTSRQINKALNLPEEAPPEGSYARTAGQFSPGVLTPGGPVTRALNVILPSVASETAGRAAKGTPLEVPARILGGVGGGVAANLPRALTATKAARPPIATLDMEGVNEGAGEIRGPDLGKIREQFGADAERRARQAVGAQTSEIADEFGIAMRKGQATQNPDDIRFEQRALHGAAGEGPYRILRESDNEQRAAVLNAGRNIATQGEPPVVQSAADAPVMVRQGLDRVATAAKAAEDEAWQAFRASPGQVKIGGVVSLQSRIEQAVREFDIDPDLGLDGYRQSGIAYNRLKAQVAGLVNSGREEVSVSVINQIRKSVSDAVRAANNDADRALAGVMNKAVNKWLDDISDTALFSGDDTVVQKLVEARALTRAYHGKYGADTLLGKVLSRNADEGQTVNALFGASKIGAQRGAVDAVKTLKSELGPTSREFQGLREAAVMRIFAPLEKADRQGAATSYAAVIENMNEALAGTGRPLMREMFSVEELVALRKLQFVIQRLHTPLGNGSQSAYELAAMASSALKALANIPALGPLMTFVFKGMSDARGTLRAAEHMRPVQMPTEPLVTMPRSVPAPSLGILPGAAAQLPRPEERAP